MTTTPRPQPPSLLLGGIAAQQGEIDNALLYYRQVPEGDQFLSARLQAARMLIDADRLPMRWISCDSSGCAMTTRPQILPSLEVELLDQVGERSAADKVLAEARDRHPNDERPAISASHA